MDELTLQSRIVKEVKKKKGWAIKMANRHQGGVPDLFIKMYTLPAVFIECKKDKLALTKLQIETLKRLHVANMPAGWLLYKPEGRFHVMYVGADPEAQDYTKNSHCITFAGNDWEIGSIITSINSWSKIEMDKLG
tara:strand:- start:7295 stop:7699 length:405 start_codon:yes stop_codon:yes gene_type:complete